MDPRETRAGLARVIATISRLAPDLWGMLSFYESIAQSRKVTLADPHTMLAMAGVGLDAPDGEETKRLRNREKKRPIAPTNGVPRKATRLSQLGGSKYPPG